MSRRSLLLTFDAFGTLFHPRVSIAKQYGDVARSLGVEGFRDEDLPGSFKIAFMNEASAKPNYGKEFGMKPEEWWGNVITQTFRQLLPASAPRLPDKLIPRLLTCFSSSEAYKLYPDVAPLFRRLRDLRLKQKYGRENAFNKALIESATTANQSNGIASGFDEIVVGVISNSDSRVHLVFESLGLRVGARVHAMENSDKQQSQVQVPEDIKIGGSDPRYTSPQLYAEARAAFRYRRIHGPPEGRIDLRTNIARVQSQMTLPDIDLLVLSYDVRASKPQPDIFHAAQDAARHLLEKTAVNPSNWLRVHVGDEFEKDYLGAQRAGWQGVLVDRGDDSVGPVESHTDKISDLMELDAILKG